MQMLLLALDGGMATSLVAIAAFYGLLTRSIRAAPRLVQEASSPPGEALPSVDIIIPAYNESENIAACVNAALTTRLPDSSRLQFWIADDQSTDTTGQIARRLAQQHANVHALTVPPRPADQVWHGKNWACAYATKFTTADYLLFIDADVRLSPEALAAALVEAQTHQTGLLSCAPKIECGCLAEWLVQPIMMSAIAIGYDFQAINDSDAVEDAFAAGPFMLFRRDAYAKIGGHAAVNTIIVEDVELARRIRAQGLKLRYVLGIDLISVRMYASFPALWEGWTKNYFLGTQENVALTLVSAFTIAMVFVMPWVGLITSSGLVTSNLWATPQTSLDFFTWSLIGLTLVDLSLYVLLRVTGYRLVNIPTRYWWLSSVGGSVVVAIALASIFKTKTGWGWTWKGRVLSR